MDVAIHSRSREADALMARCRALGVRHVCLSLNGVPGFEDTGVPDAAYLRAFTRKLADAGVQAPVAILWFGNDPDLVLNPGNHRRVVDAKLRTLEALGQAGIGAALHYIDLARSQSPDDDERYWDGLLGVFRELVAQAEAADVRLANHAIWRCIPDPLRVEALRQGVTMADYRQYHPEGWGGPYLLTSAPHIVRLLEAVPSSHNGACFCTGMHIMGGDVPALVDTFAGKIHYSQMRDLRGRWPAAEEVMLGEGDLDFGRILRRLDAAGYRGTIGPEHLGSPHHPGEDLEATAVGYLQAKLAAEGIRTSA
ncbi:MAG TPA: sugar phosphate isomerase/epimerase [Chloroflexota bacterium]|jgi:sugar phosphate isomerase/epimerase|nr:sugar phosphate isomerase/epimerase [Chloroflexota bacterium]